MQMRIAKAIREGKHGRAKSLQWMLTHSFAAKALAVRNVTENRGHRTPGVDGEIWRNKKQKVDAIGCLGRKGYRPQPLRRIYIPKKNGKKRPLSIPTMRDRSMQALHALALKPVAESTADRNSYGFREGRRCADAIAQCFLALAKRKSAKWVLEADIESCFDKISHEWLLSRIPMDREILRKWLQAGYMEERRWYPSPAGTPQGGIISPLLANLTLDGLEKVVAEAAPKGIVKVNMVRYADDFIITGVSRELLEERVKPAVQKFLAERGLNPAQPTDTSSDLGKRDVFGLSRGPDSKCWWVRRAGAVIYRFRRRNCPRKQIESLWCRKRRACSVTPSTLEANRHGHSWQVAHLVSESGLQARPRR
jgi:RNA-directed DNA polymerase